MTKLETLLRLNELIIAEQPQYRTQASAFAKTVPEQQQLFRSLCNVRPPRPVSDVFLILQDAYLTQEVCEKGVVQLEEMENLAQNIYLWQGDITRLCVDAIVNAANDALLGCFIPCHRCIDNAIHSAAGVQLRLACDAIMQAQGHSEPTGAVQLTQAYNLPCQYVLHTVGPIVDGALTQRHRDQLADCYRACLRCAIAHDCKSIAFCCISTGEFCFPNREACEIAVCTVKEVLAETKSEIKVVFNVFKDKDAELYRTICGRMCENQTAY